MNDSNPIAGNLLGSVRAEADTEMLEEAFVETSDYSALKNTDNFNFVVGRRGTGKTALYLKLTSDFTDQTHLFLHTVQPQEHDSLALLGLIRRLNLNTYGETRSALRVLWRISILFTVATDLCRNWKVKDTQDYGKMQSFIHKRRHLISKNELQRCYDLLKEVTQECRSSEELPGLIASKFELSTLEASVRNGLDISNTRAVFLFDGLDEGWGIDTLAVGILGGLAIAIAGFKDSRLPIHGEVFVRDNIFRSLAALDSDYSRHIEGNTLRLHWDEDSLLNLITSRLRITHNLQQIESNVRVWDRFAHRELKGRDGFLRCLQHTLYRPRDLLVLLNSAIVIAQRAGRTEIIENDIQKTAMQVSEDRLSDLMKEYENVFPGLRIVADSLVGSDAFQPLDSIRTRFDNLVDELDYSQPHSGDVAILGNGSQILDALFSIGLLGLVETGRNVVRFCHDGARSSISDLSDERHVAVHPCYWKALNVHTGDVSPEVLVQIHDDYEARANTTAPAQRVRLLGQLVADLPELPPGQIGASAFEEWVLRTCRILFASQLSNFELQPSRGAVKQRDVVASNNAESGFWKRVLDDYQSRQVVFEVKNYEELKTKDFDQALSYSGRQYGSFVVIVHRTEAEGLNSKVRAWIKEYWDQHDLIIMTLPVTILARCIRKFRSPSPKNQSYVERVLNKRLDTFQRRYVAQQYGRRTKAG